jgi:hypothetical protein
MNKAIGGYFELELRERSHYHKGALALNSGRNALEYVLLANGYKKVYIPHYTCDILLEPIARANIPYEFYAINERLEAVFDFKKLHPTEAFLYTNYFGLKDNYVFHLTSRHSNIIIDNAQSFFSKPQNGADTFYSPRKFFGLPDGGYAYCKEKWDIDIERDITSIDKMGHLLLRSSFDAETGYEEFRRNEESLKNQPILPMSRLTSRILTSVGYEEVRMKRIENFYFLHNVLRKSNKLTSFIDDSVVIAPLVYPFWVSNGKKLRGKLKENRIYTPFYWPNVLDTCDKDSFEYDIASNIVHLPIDQRYDFSDLKYVLFQIYKT